MDRNVAEELKKLDVEIGRKMFQISKKTNMELPPSPLQGKIIDYLMINKDKCINGKDLENYLDVSKVTISNALLSMENNGIIVRTKSLEDGRNKNIELTDKSKDVFNQMSGLFSSLQKVLIKDIEQDKLNIFYEVLDKISNNMKGECK